MLFGTWTNITNLTRPQLIDVDVSVQGHAHCQAQLGQLTPFSFSLVM